MYFGIKKKVDEEKETSLSIRISRKAFILGAKLNNAEKLSVRQDILGALELLTHAQMLASSNKKESLKLLNMANRLAQVQNWNLN